MTIIQVRIPGLRDFLGRFTKWDEDLAKEKRKELRSYLPKAVRSLRTNAPKRTGDFARSISGVVVPRGRNLTEVRFSTSDPKADFVIERTRPHLIPREIVAKHALKLPKTVGRSQFRLQVMHPGTKGSDFVFRAFSSLSPEFQVAMNRVGIRAISALAGTGGSGI